MIVIFSSGIVAWEKEEMTNIGDNPTMNNKQQINFLLIANTSFCNYILHSYTITGN